MKYGYEDYNAERVLERLEGIIEINKSQSMRQVMPNGNKLWEELSIFDWFKEKLSIADMKKMRVFLKEAIKLGYKGYVCFKVGASGCANGMWACINPTTDGYSPDGDFLYHSFTPDYDCWRAYSEKRGWYGSRDENTTKEDIRAWLKSEGGD